MDINGKDELKSPLLQHSDGIINVGRKTNTVMFKRSVIECASCATSIESALGKLSGVESVMVAPLQGQAVITYMPEHVTAKTIKETVEDAGFQVNKLPEKDILVCRLRIKGMACTSCSESAERALSMLDGVKKAVVGLALEEAKVSYDPNVTSTDRIIEAVEDAGFGADLISSGNDVAKVHLKLEGINSPEDLTIIQSLLESQEGVDHVEMDLDEHNVTVSYDPDIVGPRSLIQCIQEDGRVQNSYQAHLYNPSRRREIEKKHEIQMYKNQFWWSCLFFAPVFIFSMVLPMLPPHGNWLDYKIHNMLTLGMLLRWLLCSPVQFLIGRR